jgi:hypothetical protein
MRRFHQTVAIVAMALGAVRADAQTPSVQQVYDKFATAVGGRDAWAKVTGRSEKGTADIAAGPQTLSGSLERHQALPNKMRMIMDLGMIRLDQGFDGTKGWVDQGQGPQRMPAAQEKTMGGEGSASGATYLDPSRYAKATVDGKESFDGKDAWKLSVTTKDGDQITEFFDVATGLRIGTVSNGPAGPSTIYYREYKEFEGKKVPSKVVQSVGMAQVTLTVESVTFAAPDPALFKAPDSVK